MGEGGIVRIVLSVCLFGLLLTSCTDDGEPVGAAQQAIVGGVEDDDDTPRYPAVVVIRTPPSTASEREVGLCTGTLVSPSHVVTAAHCLADWDRTRPIQVNFGARVACFDPSVLVCDRAPRLSRTAVRCAVHPGFVVPDGECGDAGFITGDTLLRNFHVDVGVLQLDRPVPIERATAGGFKVDFHRLPDSAVRPAVGAPATAVGYGSTTFRALGVNLSSLGIRRFLTEPIDGFAFGLSQPAVVLRQDDVVGTAPGDSGGPAIWDEAPAGPWRAPPIGVASIESDVFASLLEDFNLDFVREQLDQDGDGRYDNACGTGFDPTVTSANDLDGDGVRNAEDTCPELYDPCQQDGDFDGVGDNCDTCPADWNPGELQLRDTDEDGLPDACDNCPFHDNPDQTDDDPVPGMGGDFVEFGDGRGEACDNCPGLYNPDQSNCNADAELAASLLEPRVREGGVGVGDACDPVPCGDTQLGLNDERTPVESGGLSFVVTGGPVVEVDPLASERRSARTGFRFCRCSRALYDTIEARLDCIESVEGDGGCAIPDNDTYVIRERELETWRLTTQDGDDLRHEPVLTYDARTGGFVPDLVRTWDLDADVDRWSGLFGEAYPRDGFGNLVDAVPGVLWTRTPGPPRAPDYPVGSDERDLAHHYTSGPVRGRVTARAPSPCYDFVGPFLPDRSLCPTCAQSFPLPWIGRPGTAGFGAFLPCNADPSEPPGIVIPGALLDARPSFATDPRPLLALDGIWVAASEPEPWLPPDGPRYAAVLPDAQIGRLLVQTPDGLAEPGFQPIEPVEPFGVAATTEDGDGSALVAVLSARRQLLWALTDDALLVVDLRSGERRAIGDPDEPLGRVLAATYDPASDSLVVLDEVSRSRRGHRGRARGTARLLRVPPLTGATEVVASWRRVAPTSRFALAADPGGGLWIAASGERGAHVVLALRAPWETARIAGWRLGLGVLAQPAARASSRGVSLAVVEPRGSTVVGYRWEELRPPSHAAAARCF